MASELDDVDRGILHVLQENARDATANGIGDQVGVSASTVRNRIERLEAEGVIRGYHPDIDYEQAGYQLHAVIECRAPPDRRAALAEKALDQTGVIRVREYLTGSENLRIEMVAPDSAAVDELITGLTDFGLDIVSTELVKADHIQPFNHFGEQSVNE